MTTFSYTLSGTETTTSPGAEDGDPGEIVEVADMCANGLARLATQYKDSLRLSALICAFLAPVQTAEADVNDLITEVLDILMAVGAQLDIIGAIVGEPRAGFADEDYRRALLVRVLVNRSDGKAEQLIKIVDLWTDGASVDLEELPPASVEIATVDYSTDPVRLFARLMDAKAAGVGLQYSYGFGAATFALSGTHDTTESNATTGLGSDHTATGGDLAGMLG